MLPKNLLPLYTFFSALRRHPEFSPGLEEYMDLLKALQNEPQRLESPTDLLDWCRLLWLKPGQSPRMFEELFYESFRYLSKELAKESGEEIPEDEERNDPATTSRSSEAQDEQNEPSVEIEAEEAASKVEEEDYEQLYLCMTVPKGGEAEARSEETTLTTEQAFLWGAHYLPLLPRPTQQTWRTLKRWERQGISNELDMKRTVAEVARLGFFHRVVMKPLEVNQAQLWLLIDHKGSMVAFRTLAEQIVATAREGAGLQPQTFYFRNLPPRGRDKRRLLYTSPAETDFVYWKDALTQAHAGATPPAVLIISDAGAARGRFEPLRLENTLKLLEDLHALSPYLAWVNPLPADRWLGTTADYIARHIPMFPAHEAGLRQAVGVLRGRS